MKTCIKCNIPKNISCFYKEKRNKDGYRKDCKECKNKNRNKNRKINKNKEKLRAKRYYLKNKETIKNNSKEWYEKNKENKKDYDFKYYNKTKEKYKQSRLKSCTKYRKEKPEYFREKAATRKAQKLKATLKEYSSEIKKYTKIALKDMR